MLRSLASRHLVYCRICIFPKQFEQRGVFMTSIKPIYPDRFIDKKGLKDLVPYSPSHIARMEKKGDFPRRIRPCRVGWSQNDISEWIEAKKAATENR
jgi:prophage regulatory protein